MTTLKRMTFEEAIKDKKSKYVIIGKIKEIEELNSPYSNQIEFKNPLKFKIINNAVHDTYEGVDYIDFWKRVKIYKVIDVYEREVSLYE